MLNLLTYNSKTGVSDSNKVLAKDSKSKLFSKVNFKFGRSIFPVRWWYRESCVFQDNCTLQWHSGTSVRQHYRWHLAVCCRLLEARSQEGRGWGAAAAVLAGGRISSSSAGNSTPAGYTQAYRLSARGHSAVSAAAKAMSPMLYLSSARLWTRHA